MDYRMLLAPVVTGALLLIVWTAPMWSVVSESSAVTVRAEPQLMAPGPDAAPASAAGYEVEVAVAGATAPQTVTLEVWSNDAWVAEDEGTTDEEGRLRLVSSSGAHARIVTDVDGSRVTTVVDPVIDGPVGYWAEEFEGDALSYQWLVVQQPNGGGNCTYSNDRAASVGDGLLTLTVEENPNRACKSTGLPTRWNGHVVLRAPISYGTTAARIKFPRTRGVTGQFWLQPVDPGARWEMDAEHEGVLVAGTAGTDRDPRVDTSVHIAGDHAIQRSRRVLDRAAAPNDGLFHVYSVEWEPNGYTFKIDGVTVRSLELGGLVPPVFAAVAVLAPHDRLPVDPEQRRMYVDWVRVWNPR